MFADLAALRNAKAGASASTSASTGTNSKKKKKSQAHTQTQVQQDIPNVSVLDAPVAASAGPLKLTLRSVLEGTYVILSTYLLISLISDTL